MDIHAGHNGFEVARRIRSAAGMNDHLGTPVRMSELQFALANVG